MSFFDDEDDEPPPNPRTASGRPRPSARRRPTGSGTHQQQVQTRRIVAGVLLVIVIILIIVLVGSCASSANKSSLEGYSGSVYSIVGNSNNLGKTLFSELESGDSQSNMQTALNGIHVKAQDQLQQAERLSVPGSMAHAQTALLYALRLRYNGIGIIASNLGSAFSTNTGESGVRKIAQGTAYLYASDAMYKGYAAPAIASALHGASLTVDSTTINGGQFVSDLGWLQQKFIAAKIGARLPSKDVNPPPVKGGLYGHSLGTVTVGGTTLVAGETNTVPASPAPTFVLSVTNGGDYNELDVGCTVTVKDLSDTGKATIAQTTAGQSTTCSVTLPKPPTTGIWQVTAQIDKVPGEANLTNNSHTFTINFTK